MARHERCGGPRLACLAPMQDGAEEAFDALETPSFGPEAWPEAFEDELLHCLPGEVDSRASSRASSTSRWRVTPPLRVDAEALGLLRRTVRVPCCSVLASSRLRERLHVPQRPMTPRKEPQLEPERPKTPKTPTPKTPRKRKKVAPKKAWHMGSRARLPLEDYRQPTESWISRPFR